MPTISIPNLASINQAATEFLRQMPAGRTIYAFYGGLGAGKTTFIRALCQNLGVTDIVASPSFAIINQYALPDANHSIYHFDFYRIRRLSEVYDIGYEDYFYSGELCFIEWPELIEELLPPETVRIHIQVNPDQSRDLLISYE